MGEPFGRFGLGTPTERLADLTLATRDAADFRGNGLLGGAPDERGNGAIDVVEEISDTTHGMRRKRAGAKRQ